MATKESGNAALKQQTQLQPKDSKPKFSDLLNQMIPEFKKVLPRSMSAERLCRIAMTEVRKNPTLATCDMQSVIGSIMIGAQLGLEPGVMGQAYLVPFNSSYKENGEWKKRMICTFIPGWQGYVDLVSRSGRASVWTGAVYEGDEFDAGLGSQPYLHHVPDWNADEGRRLLYTYSVGQQKGLEIPVIDVWGKAKVVSHRARYNKVGEKHYSFKDENNFEMYARKLPLLQVAKYLPKSVELQITASLDYAADAGVQALTIAAVRDTAPLEIDGPEDISDAALEASGTDSIPDSEAQDDGAPPDDYA